VTPAFPQVISEDAILRRIRELARQIDAARTDAPPALVAVMEGARVFADHLRELLPGRPPYVELRASSYGDRTESGGDVRLGELSFDVAGRDVIVIEDIVDTGRTVDALRRVLLAAGATSVRVATLLSKPSRRVVPVALDYVGFEIPDYFVIGFGMDVAGRYRALPYIGVYCEAAERAGSGS
jgi:hypoxanthine phosphoribosyltransferase